MRRYETVFILDPDLGEEVRTQRYDKVKEIITAYKGAVVEFDDWGVRKLAYDIKKKSRGHYVRLDYCGDGALVAELERNFRLDDKFLKFMTIILADNVTAEQVIAEKEEAAAAAAAKEAAEAAEAEKAEAEKAAPEAEEKAEEVAETETKEEDE
ncbi:MAG: 30S ribosomal protein S6 [Desulfobacterales bacterium]|nr:30S ribosomal protein S6 [Desulfobacterales bacterium]